MVSKFQVMSRKRWIKAWVPVGMLLLSACAMNPMEGSGQQYTSQYDRASHVVNGFDVRTVTQAPEQIVLMFRVNVQPKEAFQLVADIEKLSTWFTDIKNPAIDNTYSDRGPDKMGVNSVRSCSLDGETLVEDIVHYDEHKMSYAYAIDMDKSTLSFPMENQVSMFTVESDQTGGSLITWRHYYDKKLHVMAPVLNLMFEEMILEPAVENLFDQYGGEWVEPKQS